MLENSDNKGLVIDNVLEIRYEAPSTFPGIGDVTAEPLMSLPRSGGIEKLAAKNTKRLFLVFRMRIALKLGPQVIHVQMPECLLRV